MQFMPYWKRLEAEYEKIKPGEDASLNEESPSPADDIAALTSSVKRLRKWLVLTTLLLLATFTTFLVGRHLHITNYLPSTWPNKHPTPLPLIPTIYRTFDQDDTYAMASNAESDHKWHTLLPHGAGFVRVQHPRTYDLHKGVSASTPDTEIFGISMFHQVHCLINIRNVLYDVREAGRSGNKTRMAELDEELEDGEHINHCFDFIRNALLCAGDTTLEWTGFTPGYDVFVVEGQGIEHQCKDHNVIFDYLKKNSYDNAV